VTNVLDLSVVFHHELELSFQIISFMSFGGSPHLLVVSFEHVKIFLADIMWSWTVTVTVAFGGFHHFTHFSESLENWFPVVRLFDVHNVIDHFGHHLGVFHAFTL